ncbi:hypothetical protein RB595_008248 [Gaeumannomyces hyphopodioides]
MSSPQHPLRASARLAAVAFVAALALSPAAVYAQSDDLAAVLSKQQNVSTYTSLLSKYPKAFENLPSSGATILVPTDAAFVKFQSWDRGDNAYAEQLLRYHMLQGKVSIGSIEEGSSVFVRTLLSDVKYANVSGGAEMIVNRQRDNSVFISGLATRATLVGSPDIPFGSGGAVQLIDSVLAMPARFETTARGSFNGDIDSFLGALYAAGVLAEFADGANLTVFAPRNAAMARVGAALQAMPRDQLARVLRHHLVPGRVLHGAELRNGTEVSPATLGPGGAPLRVTLHNNDIFIGAAKVASTNFLVANGVVHLLDDVLNPDAAADARVNVTAETRAPLFSATGADGQAAPTSAGGGAALPFTTALPCVTGCPTAGGGGGAGGAGGNGVKTSSSSGGVGRVFAARPTGVAGVGVGVGVGLAVGLAGMEAMGAML